MKAVRGQIPQPDTKTLVAVTAIDAALGFVFVPFSMKKAITRLLSCPLPEKKVRNE